MSTISASSGCRMDLADDLLRLGLEQPLRCRPTSYSHRHIPILAVMPRHSARRRARPWGLLIWRRRRWRRRCSTKIASRGRGYRETWRSSIRTVAARGRRKAAQVRGWADSRLRAAMAGSTSSGRPRSHNSRRSSALTAWGRSPRMARLITPDGSLVGNTSTALAGTAPTGASAAGGWLALATSETFTEVDSVRLPIRFNADNRLSWPPRR